MRACLRILLLLPLPLLSGCRHDGIVEGLSDSTYVRAMVALRKLPLGDNIDSVSRAQARDSILRSFGISAAQMESASVALSAQPERAGALWRAIEIGGADPGPAPSDEPPDDE